MDRGRRERWQANGNVLGASGKWSRVAYPFAAVSDDGLPRRDIHLARLMLHPQRAPQDHGVLVKLRRLSWLRPAFRTAHVSDTDAGGRSVDATNILFDDFRFVPRRFNARRIRNQ